MQIHRMSANFGCLVGQTLELKEGLNIIEAPNETGKSTWCAFLAAMLYGLNTRSRDRAGVIAEKNRYLPWSGGTLLGRVDLRAGGDELTLLRTTRRAGAPLGEFRALYAGSGDVVPDLTGENCGELLTGVSREVFERSAFIRQAGLPITQDPELEKRIAALISSGEDGGAACTEALEALRRQLNRRRHNKTGQIPALETRLKEIEQKLQEAEALSRACAESRAALEALERRREVLNDELARHRRWESLQKRQTVEEAQAASAAAQAQLDALQEAIRRDRIPEVEAIGRLRGAIVNLAATEKNVDKARQQRDDAAKALLRSEAALNESPFAGKSPESAAREAASAPHVSVSHWKELAVFFAGLAAAGGAFMVFSTRTALLEGLWTYLPWAVAAGIAAVGGFLSRLVYHHEVTTAQKSALQKRFGTTDRAAIAAKAEEYARLYETLEAARAEAERCSAAAEGLHASLTANEQAILLEIRRFAPDAFDLSTADGLLRTCAQRRKELAEAQQAAREARLRMELLQGGAASLPASLGGVKAPLRSREAIEADLRALEAELAQKRSGTDRLTGRLHAAGDTAALKAEKEHLRREAERLEEEYTAIRLAMETLEEADRELQSRFSPALGRRTGEIFKELTAGSYETAVLSRDLRLSAQPGGDTQLHDIGYLSAGAADQLYLAARLAICETVLPRDKQVPLVLDDALTNFDDARCAAALRWLREEAKHRQIILFSCHSREADFFAGDEEVAVQRLTNSVEGV